MTNRWLRFRLRTLLIAVAIVAILLGVGVWSNRMWQRRSRFLARAYWHAQVATNDANFAAFHARSALLTQQNAPERTKAAESWRLSQHYGWKSTYHSAMERKYRHAADRPWEGPPLEALKFR